jgi:hypothetical protein
MAKISEAAHSADISTTPQLELVSAKLDLLMSKLSASATKDHPETASDQSMSARKVTFA